MAATWRLDLFSTTCAAVMLLAFLSGLTTLAGVVLAILFEKIVGAIPQERRPREPARYACIIHER